MDKCYTLIHTNYARKYTLTDEVSKFQSTIWSTKTRAKFFGQYLQKNNPETYT